MKKNLAYLIKKITNKNKLLKRLVFFFFKKKFADSYYKEKLSLINQWAWGDNERSNFFYDLTDLNKEHLAQTIAFITNSKIEKVLTYFDELLSNKDLYNHLTNYLKKSPEYGTEIEFAYGRRIGWYAFVRLTKPKIIIETGVDQGVGACVLSSAILKNRDEGFDGEYIGTEINPNAGKLFQEPYNKVGKIIYQDSLKTLSKINVGIDLFINDSDHSSEYEYKEYLEIEKKLTPNSFILGDNSHVTNCLSQFSRKTQRNFIFFKETPKKHWYPGAGIGISFKKNQNI